MYAITIRQPWASAILAGVKTVENRSWRPPERLMGERIAIHAGAARPSTEALAYCRARGFEPAEMPSGVILCTAVLESVHETSNDPWFMGPLGWVLRDVRPARRRAIKGRLGFFQI